MGLRSRRLAPRAAAILIVPVLLFCAMPGRAEAFSLRESLAARLESWLSSDTMEVQGLTIEAGLDLRIASLRLKDADGVWLEAKGISADWRPTALLRRRVEVSALSAEEVELLRQPRPTEDAAKQPKPGEKQSFLPDLPVTVRLDHFSAPLRLPPEFTGQAMSVAIAGSAELGGSDLLLQLDAKVDSPKAATLSAKVRYESQKAEFELAADFAEPEGGLVVPLLGLPESTPLALSLKGDGPPDAWDGRIFLTLDGQSCVDSGLKVNVPGRRLALDGIGLPACFKPGLPVLGDGSIQFAADLSAPSDDLVEIARARISAGPGQLDLSGSVRPDRADLAFTLENLDLGQLSPVLGVPARGGGRAAGTVQGPLTDPRLSLRLDLGAGQAAEARWNGLGVEATVAGVASGRIEIAGQGSVEAPAYPGAPALGSLEWRLGAALMPENGRIEIARLELQAPGHALNAQGWLERWGAASDIRLQARSADLRTLAGDAGLQGAMSLQSRISGDLLSRDFTAAIEADASPLRTGIGQVDQVLGPEVALHGSVAAKGDRIALRDVRLRGRNATLIAAGAILPKAELSWSLQVASLQPVGLTGEASATGRVEGDIAKPRVPVNVRLNADIVQASAEAVLLLDGKVPAVALSQLAASYGEESLRLAAPTRIELGQGTRLATTTLRLRSGSVTLSGGLDPRGALSGNLALNALPLSLVELAAPGLGLRGRLDGQVALAGRLDQPEATFRLRTSGLGAEAAPERLEASLAINGAWRGGVLRADLTGQAQGGITARGSGRLPLTVAGVPENGAIEASLSVQGDAGRLAELVPTLASHRLEGRLALDGSARGTLGDPILSGRLRLADGIFESYDTGTLLRGLTLRADLAADGTINVEGQASDGAAGRVSIQGGGNWRDRQHIDLRGRLQNFRAVHLDAATAAVQGDVALTGAPEQLALTGRLRVQEAVVNVSEFIGPKVTTLDVVEIGGSKNAQAPGRKTAQPPEPKAGPVVAMDVAVEIQRATIRGEGLESDWRGTVTVKGSLDRPVIDGPVNLQRGTFRILGKQLTLAPGGKVIFEGRSPPDPRLDIVALGRAEEVTAKVIVSGLASSPSLELSSEPEVPKDEILARLLFGRKLGSLGAAQQLQIAQAAASLAFGGKGGGFDPVGKIRDFLGFDTLSVGGETGRMGGGQMVTSSGLASPTGAPNAESAGGGLAPSVSAGKYIDPDTFLQVGRGEEGPSVSVERRLGGGFSIESEVGARTGGGVSLRWTKDY